MPFDYRPESEIYKIPNFAPAGANVFYTDVLGTPKTETTGPLTGSYFRLEAGPESTPPQYTYDESGFLIKGELTLKDENGNAQDLKAGDVFFIHRGSTITFSTKSYGIAYKTAGRLPM